MPVNPKVTLEVASEVASEVTQLAAACAARLRDSVAVDTPALEPQFRALLDAVRTLAPQFDFDRDGRPGAVAAVREALPLIERELFDAIIDDHAAEIAAIHEAMRQVVRAVATGR